MDELRELKEKHIFSKKILEKILDKGKGDWYDSSTGRNPLYEIRGSNLSPERPEMNLRILSPQDHIFSEKILEKIFDKGKGDWYDSSTGRNPLYEIRGSDSDLSPERPEMNLRPEIRGSDLSPIASGMDWSLETLEKHQKPEKLSKKVSFPRCFKSRIGVSIEKVISLLV